MEKYLSESVFRNQYLLERIVSSLDIRSLFRCYLVSRDVSNAANYEYQKRKDIKHIFVETFERCSRERCKRKSREMASIFTILDEYTRNGLNIRPKQMFVMYSSFTSHIHTDLDRNKYLEKLRQNLPKDCQISCMAFESNHTGGFFALPHKNKSLHITVPELPDYETAWARISCLLIPDIDGIEVKTYEKVSEIEAKEVKAILLFHSKNYCKHLSDKLTKRMQFKVSFGGGSLTSTKIRQMLGQSNQKDTNKLIVTFGGHNVRSASNVINLKSSQSILSQLKRFKNSLDFDCDNWRNSWTFAFIFVRYFGSLSEDFQNVFPFVGVNGCRTTQTIFCRKNLPLKWTSTQKWINKNPENYAVIVLIHMIWTSKQFTE